MTKQSSQPRKSEPSKTWFRSDRVYLQDHNAWYFRTREGVELGPYESQVEAEIEAGMLREMLKQVTDEAAKRAIIREFVMDSHQVGQTLTPLVVASKRTAVFA